MNVKNFSGIPLFPWQLYIITDFSMDVRAYHTKVSRLWNLFLLFIYFIVAYGGMFYLMGDFDELGKFTQISGYILFSLIAFIFIFDLGFVLFVDEPLKHLNR